MTNKKNVPEIRFEGFSGEWVEKKLGEVAKRIIRKNKNNEPLPPLTISAQYGLISQQTFFDKQIASKDTTGYFLIKKGEFAYNKSYSHGYPWGTIKRLDKYNKGVLSTLYIVFKATNISSQFLIAYYDSNCWYREVSKIATEGARNHGLLNISPLDFFDTKLYLSIEDSEQAKIGSFLSNIDNLLTTSKQKTEKLKSLKKALLQKMFPSEKQSTPDIRFEGFIDEWNKYRLGDVVNFINGRAYKQHELLDNGKYPVLRVGNFYTNEKWYYSDLELPEKNYADNGDLLYTWSASFGPHIWKGKKVIFHYHIWKVELSEKLKLNFTLQILEADKSQLLNNTNGSTMIHVTKAEMENKIISIPSIPEQTRIGQLFAKIDELIAMSEHKSQKIEELKKALLQKMFV